MPWESINKIIDTFTQEPAWESYRAWQEILIAWPQVVGTLQIPVALEQDLYPRSRIDSILYIATHNASLADHCRWRSRALLQAINSHLATPLKDVRFASSRWQPPAPPTATLDSLDDQDRERCECPLCGACTPRWELNRWAECRFCVIKRWR